MHVIKRVLSIAGSDSGGGAGIQADLKAFAACGVHGMTAITAITVQNTVGVTAVHPIPPDIIIGQVRAVASDIGLDAVKIGMLGDGPTIEAVAQRAGRVARRDSGRARPGDGGRVRCPAARPDGEGDADRAPPAPRHRRDPNLPEARALLRAKPRRGRRDDDTVEALARQIHALGPQVVVITGGHREEAIDTFFDGRRLVEIPGERYDSGAAHGSGCTHSSVLAARLARGDEPLEAARVAKALASEAVANGLTDLGAGVGPVDILKVATNPPKAIHNDRPRVRPEAEV